jgi:hypothetical protein
VSEDPGLSAAEASELARTILDMAPVPPEKWPICEHCGDAVDPEEAQPCPGCGCDFHPECLDAHLEECG